MALRAIFEPDLPLTLHRADFFFVQGSFRAFFRKTLLCGEVMFVDCSFHFGVSWALPLCALSVFLLLRKDGIFIMGDSDIGSLFVEVLPAVQRAVFVGCVFGMSGLGGGQTVDILLLFYVLVKRSDSFFFLRQVAAYP
jgi:hypothetical protein